MRKIAALLTALAMGAVLVAPSVAQAPVTSVTVDAKVTPNKAGTKRKPCWPPSRWGPFSSRRPWRRHQPRRSPSTPRSRQTRPAPAEPAGREALRQDPLEERGGHRAADRDRLQHPDLEGRALQRRQVPQVRAEQGQPRRAGRLPEEVDHGLRDGFRVRRRRDHAPEGHLRERRREEHLLLHGAHEPGPRPDVRPGQGHEAERRSEVGLPGEDHGAARCFRSWPECRSHCAT